MLDLEFKILDVIVSVEGGQKSYFKFYEEVPPKVNLRDENVLKTLEKRGNVFLILLKNLLNPKINTGNKELWDIEVPYKSSLIKTTPKTLTIERPRKIINTKYLSVKVYYTKGNDSIYSETVYDYLLENMKISKKLVQENVNLVRMEEKQCEDYARKAIASKFTKNKRKNQHF